MIRAGQGRPRSWKFPGHKPVTVSYSSNAVTNANLLNPLATASHTGHIRQQRKSNANLSIEMQVSIAAKLIQNKIAG
ncbi:hypothetical protein AB833_18565 [Chromatiales bacterium (ex Bugula neritina AB1)]|nr:hypothetical protein AB833_18565 [Chromatiales bacterium (ex Bugula neritina AB1)]